LVSSDGEVRLSATDLHAGNYHIVGVDLRNLHEVELKLNESEVKFNIPTLFLAECVLVYIDAPQVEQLLSWISKNFDSALFVNYEQVCSCVLSCFSVKVVELVVFVYFMQFNLYNCFCN
jgi:O-methyltransferase involved in polyketide biosynthesis